MQNPFEPPHASESSYYPTRGVNRLYVVWVWLVVAVLGSLLTTPVDPFSIVLCLYFAIACFACGAFSYKASSVSRVLCVMSFAAATALWSSIWEPSLDAIAVASFAYAGTSVFLGYKASAMLPIGRQVVLPPFGIAFSLGAVLGPLGCVSLSVPTVLVANRYAYSHRED